MIYQPLVASSLQQSVTGSAVSHLKNSESENTAFDGTSHVVVFFFLSKTRVIPFHKFLVDEMHILHKNQYFIGRLSYFLKNRIQRSI